MPRVLSLSLRPRTLSGLFGQEALVTGVRAMMGPEGRQPRAWMLTGSAGTGKTTTARIMAVAYQCAHMKLWGDPCEACWKDMTNPDGTLRGPALHEINASETRGVEEMGEVAKISRLRPMGCPKRVIILNEAQRISKEGQNLILDPTENPPATTVWIICTTDPQNLIAPLKRRFTTYQLRSLGFSESEKFLARAAAAAKIARPLSDLYEQAHVMGVGSPALLLQALEKYGAGSSAEDAVASVEGGVNSLRVCKAVTGGDWKSLRDALLAATPEEARFIQASVGGWLRGVMVKGSGEELKRAADSIHDLTAPAPLEDPARLLWLWPVLHGICMRYRGK